MAMSNVSLKILKMLERDGDQTLEIISKIIPKKHGDHRDFYVFSSLVNQGFINGSILPKDEKTELPEKNKNEQLLAWKYFAMSTAETTATYKERTWSIHGNGEKLKEQRFALTGAGHLYLSESSTKSADQRLTFYSSIFIGIFVAAATVFINEYLKVI